MWFSLIGKAMELNKESEVLTCSWSEFFATVGKKEVCLCRAV